MKALFGFALAAVLCLGCDEKKTGDDAGPAAPGGTTPTGSTPVNGGAANTNPSGPLWVVLSNFRTASKGLGTEVSVDYRVVSGTASGQYVIRIQKPLGGALVKYFDLPVTSSGQGTATGSIGLDFIIGNDCVAIFGRKTFGGDFKAFSGELHRGGGPTASQRPKPPVNVAGGPGKRQPGRNYPPGYIPPGTTTPGYIPPGTTQPGIQPPGSRIPGTKYPTGTRPGFRPPLGTRPRTPRRFGGSPRNRNARPTFPRNSSRP